MTLPADGKSQIWIRSPLKLAMSTSLEALSFQRLHPRAYLERFLAEGIRPDGREDDGWRNVSVNTGLARLISPQSRLTVCYWTNIGSITTADGSALVRVGDTTIVCGIKAEIAEPDLARPDQGFIGQAYWPVPSRCIFLSTYSTMNSVPNLDLPAICSPRFKPGPPGDEAQVLSERLNEVIIA